MAHEVKTVWKDNMVFESMVGNHVVRMDSATEPGGDTTGASPKQLLLASLAGCTGMDVVSTLRKMRVPFTGLEMDIKAELTDDYPKVYSHIQLIYRVFGKNLNRKKVEKAVILSKEKYCGVSAMLKKNSPIDYVIEYVEDGVREMV